VTSPEQAVLDGLLAWREDVFRVCLGFTRNSADAEDLCQDVFLKALARQGTLRNPEAPRIWLLRVARTTCLDHIRREKRRPTVRLDSFPAAAGVAVTMDPEVDLEPRLARLKEAIRRLPRRQREVFVLREYGGLSYEDIARTAGVRIGTVMSRLNRARRAVTENAREDRYEGV
jgi:RNA polymerase sigma-70 factor (ECF subfamily)